MFEPLRDERRRDQILWLAEAAVLGRGILLHQR